MLEKILVISKAGVPTYAKAVFDSERKDFYIGALERVKGLTAKKTHQNIADLLESHSESGYRCYIEDKTGEHSHDAAVLNLDSKAIGENRALRNTALEIYFQLISTGKGENSLGSIRWAKSLALANKLYKASGNNINITEDDSGRKRYELEKPLTSEMRCVLMLVIAGKKLVPIDNPDWIAGLMAEAGYADIPDSPGRQRTIAFLQSRENRDF